MLGDISMANNHLFGLPEPATDQEPATKKYVDDNSDALAASVDTQLDAMTTTISGLGVFTTGDVKFSIRSTALAGWVIFNDGTIGSALSIGTTRANADTRALFELLWNTFSDALAPVSGGRGLNATVDFDSNKTIKLLTKLGRALAFSGAGAGLTARTPGQILGAQTKVITQANLPSVNLVSTNLTANSVVANAVNNVRYGGAFNDTATAGGNRAFAANPTVDTISVDTTVGGNVPLGGSDTALDIMNPTFYLNAFIKL
jgi:hypothetical protein